MKIPDLHRLCLIVEYDGTPFHGWQIQPAQRTIQGELEAVLQRITGAPRRVIGSGRTDTGVHATGQVAAVDLPAEWNRDRLQRAFDALLPPEIRVREIRDAPSDFHPRYDATARSYRYRIGTAPDGGSPFHRRWCWDLSERPPDPGLLADGAALIPGERSFLRFAKTGQPQRGDRCLVEQSGWGAWDELGLEFRITANRYLHHMVRYLVGTMVAVARGERELGELSALLEGAERGLVTSRPAPPQGLFLDRVEYSQRPPVPDRSAPHDSPPQGSHTAR